MVFTRVLGTKSIKLLFFDFPFFMLFSLLADMCCHFAFKRKHLTILSAFPTYFSFLNSLRSGMKYGPSLFLKISPQMNSYLEAVLTIPEDSDPVIP